MLNIIIYVLFLVIKLKPIDSVRSDAYYNYRDQIREHCRPGDKECDRFRNLLSSWPTNKPKAAIYILVGGRKKRNEQLPNILKSLDVYFNNRFKYPVILFSEIFTKEQEDFIRNISSSDIYLQELDFRVPTFVNESKNEILEKTTCKDKNTKSVGYRNMCRFQSKLVFEEPILKGNIYIY